MQPASADLELGAGHPGGGPEAAGAHARPRRRRRHREESGSGVRSPSLAFQARPGVAGKGTRGGGGGNLGRIGFSADSGL